MNAVMKQIVLKDLRLNLPIMLLMAAGGLLALAVIAIGGRSAFAVGGILFITSNLAGGIFIGMYCIVQERKDQSNPFALSLPVSVVQLQYLKLIAALLIYGMPWLLLCLASMSFILLRDSSLDGTVVYSLLIQGCAFAITAAYFAVLTVSRSESLAGFAILLFNMGFSLFIVAFSQPSLSAPLRTDEIVWPGYAVLTLGIELLVVVLAPLAGLFVLSRRRDYY